MQTALEVWARLRQLEGRKFFPWTASDQPRVEFMLEFPEGGAQLDFVIVHTGRVARSITFEKFEQFLARWRSGSRSPEAFRGERLIKQARYLLPVLPLVDSDAPVVSVFNTLEETLDGSESPSGQSFAAAWKFAEAFPLIEEAIAAAPPESDGFRSTASVVATLKSLPQAATLISSALATGKAKSSNDVATNMVAWFAAEMTKGNAWSSRIVRIGSPESYRYRIAADDEPYVGPDIEAEAIEGTPKLVQHLRRERSTGLAKKKRDSMRLQDGSLVCEACDDRSSRFSESVKGDLWEVHHRTPLALGEAKPTKLADLAILCPTCHRAIHRTVPMMTVEDFRQSFNSKAH